MGFTAIIIWTADILLSSAVTGEKGYVSQEEDTHVLIRERLHAFSDIPSRYDDDIPIWRTHDKYREKYETWLLQIAWTFNQTTMKP